MKVDLNSVWYIFPLLSKKVEDWIVLWKLLTIASNCMKQGSTLIHLSKLASKVSFPMHELLSELLLVGGSKGKVKITTWFLLSEAPHPDSIGYGIMGPLIHFCLPIDHTLDCLGETDNSFKGKAEPKTTIKWLDSAIEVGKTKESYLNLEFGKVMCVLFV